MNIKIQLSSFIVANTLVECAERYHLSNDVAGQTLILRITRTRTVIAAMKRYVVRQTNYRITLSYVYEIY